MPNLISHVEINGQDDGKLREFYRQVFDWQIRQIPEMSYNMVDGAPSVGIGSGGDGPYVTFYVNTPDLQATLDKVESLGGKTVVPPMEIPGNITMAMFTDPEGHLIGLTKG